MKKDKDPVKLSFSPHSEKDIPLRVKWLNNPEVNRYLFGDAKKNTTEAEQANWFEKYRNDLSKKLFLVSYDNIPIGLVGITSINKANRRANIFIMIGADEYRCKGLSRPMLNYIINYAFNTMGLEKLIAEVNTKNVAAINLYKKCDFIIDASKANLDEYSMILKKRRVSYC